MSAAQTMAAETKARDEIGPTRSRRERKRSLRKRCIAFGRLPKAIVTGRMGRRETAELAVLAELAELEKQGKREQRSERVGNGGQGSAGEDARTTAGGTPALQGELGAERARERGYLCAVFCVVLAGALGRVSVRA